MMYFLLTIVTRTSYFIELENLVWIVESHEIYPSFPHKSILQIYKNVYTFVLYFYTLFIAFFNFTY